MKSRSLKHTLVPVALGIVVAAAAADRATSAGSDRAKCRDKGSAGGKRACRGGGRGGAGNA